jgi:phosphopantothenoylcysteine decarboxylase / phosphopantothenate---cysteine ligase
VSGNLKNKKVLLGVCGSIAAYKSVFLTRLLVKAGAEVRVVMTPSAASFVQPITFATLSKHECLLEYTRQGGTQWNNHVELGLWADVMLMAPASAGTLSKMAQGLCDNLLMGTYLSARCPVLFAPAMDEDMWRHPSTQANIEALKSYGNVLIPVGEGELASGLNGPGRMAEPEDIIAFLDNFFAPDTSILKGKKVLVTAGPTYEHIDPVRFIGNHSSGKMGIALARAFALRGAEVHLVLGPSTQTTEDLYRTTRVVSSAEMLHAASADFDTLDIAVFSAAVADYTPLEVAEHKIKKSDDCLDIRLKKNTDIAATFGMHKRAGQLSVGFALETEKELEHAQIKLKKKNFDFVVLNSLQDQGAGFRHDTNKVTILDKDNKVWPFELKSKEAVAQDIVAMVEKMLS